MSAVTVGRNVRAAMWTILAVLVGGGVIWFAVFTANKAEPPVPPASADSQVVRGDSHRLTSPPAEKPNWLSSWTLSVRPAVLPSHWWRS